MRARCGDVAVDLKREGGMMAVRPWRSWYRIQKTKAGTSKVAILSIVMLAGLLSLAEDAVTTASTYENRPNDEDAIAAPIQSTE